MAIEKMSLINLVGNMVDLDQTLLKCLECGYFHPEVSIHSTQPSHGFTTLEGESAYTAPLNSIIKLASDLKLTLDKSDFDMDTFSLKDTDQFMASLNDKTDSLTSRKREIKESISQHEQAIIQIKHLAGLNVSFDDIFACEYVKVRFGRLPFDSYEKLNYYDNKTFFFFPFDNDGEYYWGAYFAPSTIIGEIDNMFTSLYFERMRVPSYAHGTPEIATSNINAILLGERKELNEIREKLAEIKNENEKNILSVYSMLKFAHATFHDLKKYVATVNNRFYMIGFIPKVEDDKFISLFDDLNSVDCIAKPHDADPSMEAPVKLKNNKFSKPFEIFVRMYSLPSYSDIDPTSLVAVTYTLLFGIMFGDLGQGLVLALLGWYLGKYKKIGLGKIMTRIGFSSALFGTLYGSVFGYEELLNPMYKSVFGLATKPIHVFDTHTTNLLLGGAIGIGALLIIISICINIVLGFKTKNYERAILGNNGIAGLVLYVSVAYGLLDMMMFQKGVFTLPYIIFLIVIPILCMFLRDPLSKLLSGRKDFMPENIGEFIIENFFELFEYLLSYLSNSMSFLRVGGFILSHAGMMAVVMSLSEMVGSAASPIVIVIGNLFVMCLEGLIVGIQVLRLEFYEIFSRNFEGNGKPYEPATVLYKVEE
ncbi:MAG: V-type ATPase 116kDa subunit family protein [Oscillospiraceae bacterium]